LDFDKLFIFEIANNHSGDMKHGLEIVRQVGKVCEKFDFKFAFKLQYRDLDTFIHPDFKGRKDIKYVKRFEDTRLKELEFKALKDEITGRGFLAICTPFDEASVGLIEKHGYDAIKIGSCSFTDWPLLERIVQADLPLIASTAGAGAEEIDQVVTFLEHRAKKFCIMHCVGEYPTKNDNLQLNQIDFLKDRYPGIAVGFSTHEDPENYEAVKLAIAKGAQVFERHVSIPSDKYPLNAYSSTPGQIEKWLDAASRAFRACGVAGERYAATDKEKSDLAGLRRGVFARTALKSGIKLNKENIFFAIPCEGGQLTANDISKYAEYTAAKDIGINEPILFASLKVRNLRERVLKIIKELKEIILKSHIVLSNKVDLELSHHYGIERYEEWGAAILNCINREYCKKIIILLPGQKHPFHYHLKKEETFQVLYGNMDVTVGKEVRQLKAGDMLTVERSVKHNFATKDGVIFEEVSTTHYKDDSFYDDKSIAQNLERKTELTFRADWLYKNIR
jgi:N-acetylneuraminate synthase